MDYSIEKLPYNELHEFWTVFKHVLSTEFPGYSSEVLNQFFTKLYTEHVFRYYLENNLKTILVAKTQGTIVGFAVIDEPYGGVSLLRWLGIQKEYQKKGIGTRLIHMWLELARQQGCHKAEVAAQPEAKEFYTKAGLELEGHRKRSYFGIDQYIFGEILIS